VSFEIKPGRRLARILYLEGKAFPGNVLAWVYKDKGSPGWCLLWRFRYYVDDRLDETSQDTNRWYAAKTAEPDLAKVLPNLREPFSVMAAATGANLEEVIIDSEDPEEILRRMGEQPWANVRVVEKEPAS
jgi:hypothetical protein